MHFSSDSDDKEFQELLKKAIRGDILEQVRLAQYYFSGKGVIQDKEKAVLAYESCETRR